MPRDDAESGSHLDPEALAQEIEALRTEVKALDEEFDLLQRYYEAWLPMAEDRDLQNRVSAKRGSNTFIIIRYALRREMVLSLLRIWDRDTRKKTPSLDIQRIAKRLENEGLIGELARRRADQSASHDPLGPGSLEDVPEQHREAVWAIFLDVERRNAAAAADHLRKDAKHVAALIASYEDGEMAERLVWLRDFRNQHLAHRRIRPSIIVPEPKKADRDIEAMYRHTLHALRVLLAVVHDTDYDPERSQRIRRKDAKHFWDGVHS